MTRHTPHPTTERGALLAIINVVVLDVSIHTGFTFSWRNTVQYSLEGRGDFLAGFSCFSSPSAIVAEVALVLTAESVLYVDCVVQRAQL